MNPRRKKLLFHSQHCGMKENDILLGRFAAETIMCLSESEMDAFEALLRETDNDIYNWVTEREPVPMRLDHAFVEKLIMFNKSN